MATYTGFVRDFTDSAISGIEIYVHPVEGPGYRRYGPNWDRLFVDKPFPVEWEGSSGLFEVELEPLYTYRLEFLWPDPDRSRVGQSWWSEPFRVPGGEGSYLSSILPLPTRNGLIRVMQSDPGSNLFDQYVYNEETGDLFERR